jgi:hypothetical protein
LGKTQPQVLEGFMKRTNYMKRATIRFLEGTKFRTPVEAVEAGVRSLGDWADMLAEERELEMIQNSQDRRRLRELVQA